MNKQLEQKLVLRHSFSEHAYDKLQEMVINVIPIEIRQE